MSANLNHWHKACADELIKHHCELSVGAVGHSCSGEGIVVIVGEHLYVNCVERTFTKVGSVDCNNCIGCRTSRRKDAGDSWAYREQLITDVHENRASYR